MQKITALISGFLSLLILSPMALAHGGHDHSSWLSQPIHMLTVAAVLTALVVGIVFFSKKASAKKQQIR